MQNFVLMQKNKELEELSASLGFEKTLFLDTDFVLVKSKQEMLKPGKKLPNTNSNEKLIIYEAEPEKKEAEELLRFALEKSKVNIVFGLEKIHPKDSVHFVRGGLDQILCKIAAERGKTIGFSFSEVLNAEEPKKILKRMAFNISLCRKYGVKMLFSTFARDKSEFRSAKDLEAFARVLGL